MSYLEPTATYTQGTGFTQRITIDISESAYVGRHIYAAVDGPDSPGHTLLVGFESAADTSDSSWERRRWGFFAVPEPETVFLFIALGILFLGRFAPSSKARTAMNARQVVFGKVAVAALALLAADGAAADVTLSVVDAAPTAQHDGTLPGIGETIFSADVHVEVTPDDAWISGGIGMLLGTRKPEVYLYYAHDPNTGEVLLTAPGFDNDAQMFGTFMSEPRGQTQPARFQAAAAVGLLHDYWGGSPVPEAEPDWLDVVYIESPVTGTQGSGFTQRVTIDISESAYAGRSVYAALDGPVYPSHTLLVGFESAAGTSDVPARTRRWGFFVVPEPATGTLLGVLLVLGWLLCLRRPRRGGAALYLVLAVVCHGRTAVAQTALVGPQVRLDASGPFGANETHVSSNHVNPMEAVAGWHEFFDLFGDSRVAFGITLDGGRTWRRELLELPDGCTNSNDPFTFFDNLTGRMWIGAAASGCPGRRIVLALKAPSSATVGATVGDRVFL